MKHLIEHVKDSAYLLVFLIIIFAYLIVAAVLGILHIAESIINSIYVLVIGYFLIKLLESYLKRIYRKGGKK